MFAKTHPSRAAGPGLDGAFQRHDVVLGLHADVAILQECFADEARMDAPWSIRRSSPRRSYSGRLWFCNPDLRSLTTASFVLPSLIFSCAASGPATTVRWAITPMRSLTP